MKQDELWDKHCQEIIDFINTNKRRPSKYRPEELKMVYWLKYCRKQINQGRLSDERKEKFAQLMSVANKYQRKNQYQYTQKNDDHPTLWKDKEWYTRKNKDKR